VIFPSEEFKPAEYQQFLDSAHNAYEEFNNRGQAAKRRQEAEQKEEAARERTQARAAPRSQVPLSEAAQRPPSVTRRQPVSGNLKSNRKLE